MKSKNTHSKRKFTAHGHGTMSNMADAVEKTVRTKPAKPFRELQDRFVDQPEWVHRGEILKFESENKEDSSAHKRSIKKHEEPERIFKLGKDNKMHWVETESPIRNLPHSKKPQ